MRGLTVLAMVLVKILLMDSSVIATLDSSEILVKQVCFQLEHYVTELFVD